MATVDFILQNMNDRDEHLSVIKSLLSWPEATAHVLSLAYVTGSGAKKVEEELGRSGARCTIYVGIGNGTTSEEGLKGLLKAGATVCGIYGGRSQRSIFHPKFYVAFNDKTARVILGSANLTDGGLVQNVEASSMIDLDLTISDDYRIFAKLMESLEFLKRTRPDNVVRVTSVDDIRDLVSSGRLEANDGRPRQSPGGEGGPDAKSLYQPKARPEVTGSGAEKRGCKQPPEGYESYFRSILNDPRVLSAFGGNVKKPSLSNRQTVKSIRRVEYSACFEKDGTVMGEVVIFNDLRSDIDVFEKLYAQRASLEQHFEGNCSWTARSSNKARFFVVSRPYPDVGTNTEREAIREWHIRTLVRLREVLGRAIERVLDLTD